ncbi:MAG: hypothetical protein KDA75_11510 [Planctomycetaceae bacterium]|nr:hypothetical protein [Planctomycetaceae bacterium]
MFPRSLTKGLVLLAQGYRYARDTNVDPWQFAVELENLLGCGVTINDLRWLMTKGFVSHQLEVTPSGAAYRQFQPLSMTHWPQATSLVLTPNGYLHITAALEGRELNGGPKSAYSPQLQVVPTADEPATHAPDRTVTATPEWDPTLRELRFRGELIKRYRVPAPNQELVLNAFQDDGWPEWIEDPNPPVQGVDPIQRLLATVKSLNRNQLSNVLTFHCQTNAGIVSWSTPHRD